MLINEALIQNAILGYRSSTIKAIYLGLCSTGLMAFKGTEGQTSKVNELFIDYFSDNILVIW